MEQSQFTEEKPTGTSPDTVREDAVSPTVQPKRSIGQLGVQACPQSMRPFLIVWIGQAFSLLGSMLVHFAIIWWMTQATGSATILAMATLVGIMPSVLIGPFAGALVDRWSRKTILITADSLSAVATLLLASLFALNVAAVWMVFALLLIRAIAGAFHWPAMQASTTMLVPKERLARAAGMNQILSGLAGIFIPPLGALAIETMSLQTILAIDVATAIPAVACLLLVTIPQPTREVSSAESPGRPSLLADIQDGLTFIFRWRGLLYLTLVGLAVGILGQASASLIPLMVSRHFGGSALQLGWWQSGYGTGFVIGGLILARSNFKRRMFISMLALMADGLVCIFIGLASKELFVLTVVAMAMLGILEAMIFGLNGAIGQTIIPPEMQGRIFSLVNGASGVAAPLGLMVAGPFTDAFGVQVWWLLSAILITAIGLTALFTPSLIHIEEDRNRPQGAIAESVAV